MNRYVKVTIRQPSMYCGHMDGYNQHFEVRISDSVNMETDKDKILKNTLKHYLDVDESEITFKDSNSFYCDELSTYFSNVPYVYSIEEIWPVIL